MTFKIGDRVVHPQYGVGKVVNLEEREFESGVMRRYYEVSIPGSTVWVPSDQPGSGLRGLTVKSEIARCRKILGSHPLPLTEDARARQAELSARLKRGTISAHCEVVRDLYAYGEHKSLYGTVASFFRAAQDVLCQEWAVVEGVTPTEALHEVTILLEKSRLTLSQSTA